MRYGNHRRRTRSRHVRRRPRRFESLEARVVLDAALADAASDPPIAFYFIADVESDETLTELTPGATIDPALVAGREVTLYALANLDDSDGASIESAIVTLDSGPSNRENVSPYAWLGDTNGDFKSGVVLEEGSHVFRAIFYSENNASGTLLEDVSLQFSVESGSENQPPVAVADGGATSEDTSTVIDVLANDTDPDGETLEVQSVGDAENGCDLDRR